MPKHVPSQKTMQSLLELTKLNPDGAFYLHRKFAALVKREKLEDQFQGFLSALWSFAQSVLKQFSIELPMDGRRVLSPEARLVDDVDMPSPVPEGEDAKNVSVGIAEAEGKIIINYTTQSNATVSKSSSNYLDSLFQLWMAERGVRIDGNVIFEKDPEGHFKKITLDDMVRKMNHSESGFNAYVQQQTKGCYRIASVAKTPMSTSTVQVTPQQNIQIEQPSSAASSPDDTQTPGASASSGAGGRR